MGLLTPTVVKTSWSLLTSLCVGWGTCQPDGDAQGQQEGEEAYLMSPGSEMPPGVTRDPEGASAVMVAVCMASGAAGGAASGCGCWGWKATLLPWVDVNATMQAMRGDAGRGEILETMSV